MEVIRVLRDEEPQLAYPLELDEGEVGCVWLDLSRRDPPGWRWKACVTPRPHPIRSAKVGDARVGADARTREGDDVPTLGDPSSDSLDMLF